MLLEKLTPTWPNLVNARMIEIAKKTENALIYLMLFW